MRTLGCFVSKNYRAKIGDFTNPIEPKEAGEYGPNYVFGLSVNSGDYYSIEPNIKTSFQILEKEIPDLREKLSYLGVLEGDCGFLNKSALRENIENILNEVKINKK